MAPGTRQHLLSTQSGLGFVDYVGNRFWPKATAGVEWRVAAFPSKTEIRLILLEKAAFDPKRTVESDHAAHYI